MQRASTFAVGMLVAVLVAGCGSGSSGGSSGGAATPTPSASQETASQYRASLAAIARQEQRAQGKVGAALHAKSVGTISSALTAFAADQAKVATELSALAPPADAVTANTALARAFRDNAAATRQVAGRVAHAKNTKQAFRILQNAKAAQATGRAIDAALAALKKLGYTKGS